MIVITTLDDVLNEQVFKGNAFDFDEKTRELYKNRLDYFNEFFDTSRLSASDVYNFIFNKEEELHTFFKNMIITFLHMDLNDINETFEKYNSVDGKNKFIIDFNKNELPFRQFYRNFVKGILWLSFYTPMANNQTTDDDFSKDDIQIIKYYREKNINGFYRGQSNFEWQLKPSLLRGYDFKSNDGRVIDLDVLYDIYHDVGLIDKYNNTVGNKRIKSGKDIDYEFLSFMQHAVSYSPLIDFTGKIDVAYKFALQKSSPNTYLQNSSAVFILSFEHTGMIEDLSKINIIYLNKKIKPGTIMQVIDSNGTIKRLDFTTISKIQNQLRPKFAHFESKTNDRMKYQDGKFILFYDYVAVKGNVYYMLNKQMHLTKRKIRPSKKDKILSAIDGDLNISYLMNPYQVFND